MELKFWSHECYCSTEPTNIIKSFLTSVNVYVRKMKSMLAAQISNRTKIIAYEWWKTENTCFKVQISIVELPLEKFTFKPKVAHSNQLTGTYLSIVIQLKFSSDTYHDSEYKLLYGLLFWVNLDVWTYRFPKFSLKPQWTNIWPVPGGSLLPRLCHAACNVWSDQF